jgi:hypothetical protein
MEYVYIRDDGNRTIYTYSCVRVREYMCVCVYHVYMIHADHMYVPAKRSISSPAIATHSNASPPSTHCSVPLLPRVLCASQS